MGAGEFDRRACFSFGLVFLLLAFGENPALQFPRGLLVTTCVYRMLWACQLVHYSTDGWDLRERPAAPLPDWVRCEPRLTSRTITFPSGLTRESKVS